MRITVRRNVEIPQGTATWRWNMEKDNNEVNLTTAGVIADLFMNAMNVDGILSAIAKVQIGEELKYIHRDGNQYSWWRRKAGLL